MTPTDEVQAGGSRADRDSRVAKGDGQAEHIESHVEPAGGPCVAAACPPARSPRAPRRRTRRVELPVLAGRVTNRRARRDAKGSSSRSRCRTMAGGRRAAAAGRWPPRRAARCPSPSAWSATWPAHIGPEQHQPCRGPPADGRQRRREHLRPPGSRSCAGRTGRPGPAPRRSAPSTPRWSPTPPSVATAPPTTRVRTSSASRRTTSATRGARIDGASPGRPGPPEAGRFAGVRRRAAPPRRPHAPRVPITAGAASPVKGDGVGGRRVPPAGRPTLR